jgi:hypothetical protein
MRKAICRGGLSAIDRDGGPVDTLVQALGRPTGEPSGSAMAIDRILLFLLLLESVDGCWASGKSKGYWQGYLNKATGSEAMGEFKKVV